MTTAMTHSTTTMEVGRPRGLARPGRDDRSGGGPSGDPRRGQRRYGQLYTMTEQQRALLLDEYDSRPSTIDRLMPAFPGVPRWRVKLWGRELGRGRVSGKAWSEREITYLRANLSRLSIWKIAAHLGRSYEAVKLKAARLGLTKSDEGYTLAGLMQGLGEPTPRRILSWVERGWLHARRRQTERVENGDLWLFTDQDIREFVTAHPAELDQRRFDWLWLADVLLGGKNGLGSLSEGYHEGEPEEEEEVEP